MGGKTTSTSATKLNQLSVQSSSLGLCISLGWGRNRLKCNLIWYGGFIATAHTTKTSAGKGLGGGSKNTTYTYTASVIMALCEGLVSGIRTVYRDTSVFTNGATSALTQAGLSFANGAVDQPVWGYLASRFPDQALAYSGIAYVYAQDYDLGDSATLSNHSFEVDFATQLGGGVCDADPRDILVDFLTNPARGVPGWSAGLLSDLSDWSLYCRASNLLLSPVLESQVAAADSILEWTMASNSGVFWSEGLLKVRPYGDAPITGNGVTWTPGLTPIYDLTEDDFIPDGDGRPVRLEIVDQSDAYNIVQLEYLDRANQYNVAIATAQDLANIVEFGRRKQDPVTVHSICDADIAQHVTQLLLQRTLYVRSKYRFSLPWDYVLLEPTDYVTLTTTTDELRLSRVLVRIIEIEEDEDGNLTMLAEEVPVGAASAALYSSHSSDGYQPNADVAPGSVSTPALFNAPAPLATSDPQVWCAVGSTSPNWGGCEVWISVDDVTYSRVGRIDGPARYGALTAALPAHADPDGANTMAVSLAASRGSLGSATTLEANAGGSLCLVDDELVCYETATLTGANTYNLTTLRRGFMGTAPAAHALGAKFVRLDDAIFKFSYATMNVGSTIYVKLPSFNVFGRGLEDISTVPAYTVALTRGGVPAPAQSDWTLTGVSLSTGTGSGSMPALQLTGAIGNPSASEAIVELRTVTVLRAEDNSPLLYEDGSPMIAEDGYGPWTASPSIPTGTTIRLFTDGIAPSGAYQAALSYVVNGVRSDRTIYGPRIAGGVTVARSAYQITGLDPEFPVSSDQTSLYVAAFSATIDDGRTMQFPVGTVSGLTASTRYSVFWRISTSAYEAAVYPALAQKASSDLVFIENHSTLDALGAAPPPTTAPPGYGGTGPRELVNLS